MPTRRAGALLLVAAIALGCDRRGGPTGPREARQIQAVAGDSGTVAGPAPYILAASPATVAAGGTLTLTGGNFGASPAVTIADVSATVVSASATQLQVTVPARASFACRPTQAVVVSVATAKGRATTPVSLSVATQRALAVGQSIALTDASSAECNELAVDGGTYVVSVFADGTAASQITPFRLRGAVAGADVASAPLTVAATRELVPVAGDSGRMSPHERRLESNRQLIRTLGARAAQMRKQGLAVQSATAAPLPAVGDTMTLSVTGASDPCNRYVRVRARVVYVGTRSVVLEDVATPGNGTNDVAYRSIGQEYDDTQYGIIRNDFADMMVADQRGWGRLMILATPEVARLGLGGFVTAADDYPASVCAGSNMGLIAYVESPTTGNDAIWARNVEDMVVHEAKHVATTAVQVVAGKVEESWLEEGTAVLAEEIWARTVYGNAQNSNATYARTLQCDMTACAGKPWGLYAPLERLSGYLADPEGHSPFGGRGGVDWTWYSSAWWLVRWAIDQTPGSESAFITALMNDPTRTGLANLQARTGRTLKDMLADYTLALAVDDYPDFRPANPRLSFPSWNLPDLLAGLHAAAPTYYPSTSVLQHPVAYGNFTADNAGIRAGSAAWYVLSGARAGAQLLELSGAAGGALPGNLGMAIARVR